MKKLSVAVPFTGVCYVNVEVSDDANSDEIIEAAFDSEDLHLGDDADFEWDVHKSICKGNVLYAQQNEISWEEFGE